MVGKYVQDKECIKINVFEIGRSVDGLCVVTKANACNIVRCESAIFGWKLD